MKTFAYSLKQGVKNIVQNRLFSLAAVGTISTCLFLLGLFYVLLSNFQYMVHHAESSVGVTVFFEKNISQMRIKEIGEEIKACEGVRCNSRRYGSSRCIPDGFGCRDTI